MKLKIKETLAHLLKWVNRAKITSYSAMLRKELTSTSTTYTTYNGRKFSDYDLLIFRIGASATNTRRTVILPSVVWTSGAAINEGIMHGSGLNNKCSVVINYRDDTSVTAYVGDSGAINHIEIYGSKIVGG